MNELKRFVLACAGFALIMVGVWHAILSMHTLLWRSCP
jgi:hypothetical protein